MSIPVGQKRFYLAGLVLAACLHAFALPARAAGPVPAGFSAVFQPGRGGLSGGDFAALALTHSAGCFVGHRRAGPSGPARHRDQPFR